MEIEDIREVIDMLSNAIYIEKWDEVQNAIEFLIKFEYMEKLNEEDWED